MGLLFKDDLHDHFGTWPLAYSRYGGGELGELQAIARAVGDGDDSAFLVAWCTAADNLEHAAEAALAKGHVGEAHELLLRASCFHSISYRLLFGTPIDPRIVRAQHRQVAAFDRAMSLADPPAARFEIPFEGTAMPAYFIPATGRSGEVRPLLILTNGYDATITDMYLASATAASRRGYHCLLFDGPGQGSMLIDKGVTLRPDWETVIKAVVDAALRLPQVDPARIALSGWSLGGYLAPRAASGERRLAACIADPGQLSIAEGFRKYAIAFGATPDAARTLGELDQGTIDKMAAAIAANRRLHWSIVQRGFWVNGVDSLRDYLRSVERFTIADRVERITCPTLITRAENDPIADTAESLFEKLKCPKKLIRFTAADGAGGHCEMGNRSLLNRRVLDWLDDVLDKAS
jgi:pimeloyl-ACP methyl ester carboxylesterase